MRYGARALLGIVTAAAVFAACTDSPTSTTTAAPVRVESTSTQSNLLGGVITTLTQTVNTLLASPVTRDEPLASDVSWTFTAGPGGGATFHPGVGLSVIVPPGALANTQRITVTALKGRAIAYRFEPHLEFERKVVLTQDLRGTSMGGLLRLPVLKGAHFEGDRPSYTSSGLAIVTELVSALASPWTKTASFGVDHFSGWILASGYSDE